MVRRANYIEGTPGERVDTLGELIRETRLEKGLDLEAVADPEFTPHYIAAIESGTLRPSDMAMAYEAQVELAYAKLYGMRALGIYEAEKQTVEVATIRVNLAETLSKDGQFTEAKDLLDIAQPVLEKTDLLMETGALHRAYAGLYRKQGQSALATQHIGRSIGFAEAACRAGEVMGSLLRVRAVFVLRPSGWPP